MSAAEALEPVAARPTRHVVLVTYGEPPTPSFLAQLKYSWRILLGLTRSVAPIPYPALPMIALARARLRNRTWRAEKYGSPLERITVAQVAALRDVLQRMEPGTDWRVHAAYEFRDPLLARLLDRLDGPVDVVPMYLTDSAFTHELTRRCASQWRARWRRASAVRVLPAMDERVLADVMARHVEREIERLKISVGREDALLLAAHGTLLEPPRPMETGRLATERIARAIADRVGSRFGRVSWCWLNHVYGGRWTEPAVEVALADLAEAGIRRVIYFPYGFLADNAESELEGRVALRGQPKMESVHLACVNDAPEFIEALASHVLGDRPANVAGNGAADAARVAIPI
ncbi:MAG TPA: ferrochelatase [Candidatus Udaeobacter sp.]|jgi:protoheme ferro-lyase|nr:ferrochelatase [Candidatus Udaeobacter sp.]